MACRRVGKLHPPACEKGVAGDEECVGTSACKSREDRIDLATGAGIDDIRLNPIARAAGLNISKRGLRSETDWT